MGQYDYQGETYMEDFKPLIRCEGERWKWIYIGQLKNKTNIRDGIGIIVWNNGDTFR